MHIKKIPVLMAVPFIALSLSACGDSGASIVPTATQESSEPEAPSPSATPATDGTTCSQPGESGCSDPEETTPAETADADSSGRPSREEVKAGLTTGIENSGARQQYENTGATPEQMDRLYTCIVDNFYDEVSTETLQGIASGDVNAQLPADDYDTVYNANRQCSQQLFRELTGETG
ncbi:MAG: hypothetical protein Q3979_05005 [Actinomycetaceae bacterium]|nr:hypothetical protein [Actinomycetaceae bacterium]